MIFLHEATRRFTKRGKNLRAFCVTLWMNLCGGNMQTLIQDLRYGARMLLKKPGFTTVAVITLALGIGANTAIFSIVNSLLLSPLPYRDSERLVIIWTHSPGANVAQDWPSPGQFSAIKSQNSVFEEMALAQGTPVKIGRAHV